MTTKMNSQLQSQPNEPYPPYWGVEHSLPDRDKLDLLMGKTKGRMFSEKGAGFLGSLLGNHNIIWDETCDTAWCDGETLGFNPWFFFVLNRDEKITLLVHELWHTGFDHMSRFAILDEACHDVWNMAADFVINNMMDTAGYKFTGLLKEGCLDHQYDGMTTEEVYELLKKPGGGNPNGSMPGTLSGDLRAPDGDNSGIDIKSKIVQAKQASKLAREAGVIPGEVELIIDEFLNPILPWEVLLQRYFNEMSKDDYSWKRPSRRYDRDYLPSLMGENGLEHLIYYLDVSGSVSDKDIQRFNSEVKFIHSELTPKKLTLVTFDTEIRNEYVFEDDDAFEKIKIQGRGGTSLDPVRKHIVKHNPTAAVIFTDLYCHPITADPGVPLLWVVVDNKSAKTHFGQQIHIKSE